MIRFNSMTTVRGWSLLCATVGLLVPGAVRADETVKTATLTPQLAQQLAQLSGVTPATISYKQLLAMNAGGRQKPVEIGGRSYPFAIRLGATLSPNVKFIGGADLTIPSLGLGANWAGRLDAEAIVSANIGGNSTLVPLTFNEVYFAPVKSGSVRFYGGAGIGLFIGSDTNFGGKVFGGARFSQQISGEIGVLFPGQGDGIVTAQVRVSL